jgi:predicted Ser/Thr protein kinase
MTDPHSPEKYPASIDDIFNDAMELGPSERPAFLDEVCAGDPRLRRDVEEMIELAEQNPELLKPPDELRMPESLGRYRIVSQIGRGGMGVVYKAIDTQLDRTVALKVLPQDLGTDRANLERFEKEARVLASLNDERIATLHSLEQHEDVHFLTMEYVEGRTLAGVLEDGPMGLTAVLDICGQLARALEAAHAKGIVHRDLKPANVMLTPSGRVKILDFGIAKTLRTEAAEGSLDITETSRGSTAMVGTPEYMSPEQISGDRVDHRCDLWAFGCVLVECLTGKRLLRMDASVDTGLALADRRPDIPPLPRETPARLRALIAKCLEIDPERRMNSSTEVRRTLKWTAVRMEKMKRIRLAALAVITVLIGAAVLGILLRDTPGVVSVERVDTRTIQAIGDNGEPIWMHRFPEDIIDPHGVPGVARLVQTDKGSVGVVAATYSLTKLSTLWYLDSVNGDVLWKKDATWVEPLSTMSVLHYQWYELLNWPGVVEPVVAAGLRDGLWYNFAVRFLNLEGETIGTYYHPGPLYFAPLPEFHQRDDGAIMLIGLNSSARFVRRLVPFETDEHCGCVVLLDPSNVDGQAFPYSEGIPTDRDWPGMPRAEEAAYLVISPLHPAFDSEVTQLWAGRVDSTAGQTIQAVVSDGRIFMLDRDLRPSSCYITVGTPADSLRSLGEAEFLPVLYMHGGAEEFIDVPIQD